MNVLIISGYNHMSIGGAEKYIREVITIGKRIGVNFTEISLLDNYKNVSEKHCETFLINSAFSKIKNPNALYKLFDYYLKIRKINEYLKNHEIDLIIVNGANVSLQAKYLKKCLFIQHNDNLYYEKMLDKLHFKLLNISTIYKKAHGVVCFSEDSAKKFEEKNKNNNRKYFVIPLFLHKISSLKINPQNIVFLGRLSNEKGIQSLIDLSRLINQKINVYGTGPISLKNESNIIDHGYISHQEIDNVFVNAKLNILLSKSEGLPFSIIEGFSYGVPCLILNSFTNAKFLVNNKQNGILCDKNISINEIASIINTFDHNEFSSENIKLFCKENFNYDIFKLKWEKIFLSF